MKKLVRDNIPQIIKSKEENPKFYIADNKEYWSSLKDKLKEETNEFIKSESKEEFADILEVIDAIGKFKKFNKKEILEIKNKKAKLRGKFNKRFILEQ
ncbi:MAG: nucleoside triphosphate pyrophosphohydrolase [Nanoarchaeota archaeon]